MTEDPRISEIRAVLNAYYDAKTDSSETVVLARVTSIIDRPAPAPRVFFRGDVVPGDVCVQAENGDEYRSKDDRILIAGGPYVEVFPMTRDEWRAHVERAKQERGVQS